VREARPRVYIHTPEISTTILANQNSFEEFCDKACQDASMNRPVVSMWFEDGTRVKSMSELRPGADLWVNQPPDQYEMFRIEKTRMKREEDIESLQERPETVVSAEMQDTMKEAYGTGKVNVEVYRSELAYDNGEEGFSFQVRGDWRHLLEHIIDICELPEGKLKRLYRRGGGIVRGIDQLKDGEVLFYLIESPGTRVAIPASSIEQKSVKKPPPPLDLAVRRHRKSAGDQSLTFRVLHTFGSLHSTLVLVPDASLYPGEGELFNAVMRAVRDRLGLSETPTQLWEGALKDAAIPLSSPTPVPGAKNDRYTPFVKPLEVTLPER